MTNLSGANLNRREATGPKGEGRDSPSNFPRYPEYKDSGVEWLGNVPEHWEVKQLKHLLIQITDRANRRSNPIALENIESWSGCYIETESDFSGEGIAFQAGDLLFGKLRPYLAKVYLSKLPGEALGDFHVIRPSAKLVPQFAFHQLLQRQFISVVDGATHGAKMPRVGWEVMGNMPFINPPATEQKIIASFLDHETARIDALVEEQQRLIALLKEKRQAVISHAVTKGLDPDVPMKDSGVEWLGEVPEHWEISRIGWLSLVGNGSTPSRNNPGYWDNGNYPWLNSAKVNLDRVVESDQFVTVKALKECTLPIVRPGSVLMAITGEGKTRGMVTITEIEATINQHVAFIEPRGVGLLPTYLHDWLSANYTRIRHQSADWGSTKAAITCSDIRAYLLPLPPINEQKAISQFIRSKSSLIDGLIFAANENVALLQERRSALISAAVTGKIDVRGWQPPEKFQAANDTQKGHEVAAV